MDEKVKIIEIPKISDQRGNLSFISYGNPIPFDIKNVFYIYDIPGGTKRGGHAHKKLEQILIPLSGSFDVVVKDTKNESVIQLNRPNRGLYIGPLIWREMKNFSSGSVCLVVASLKYDEKDYLRDFAEFIRYIRK
tara:strand:+ start:1076 stop:1480 length:405 start_codon:yes stop_codon:yes gene_type:complete